MPDMLERLYVVLACVVIYGLIVALRRFLPAREVRDEEPVKLIKDDAGMFLRAFKRKKNAR